MKQISVFNHLSADGLFAGPNGEIDWFKLIKKDEEYDKFIHEQSKSGHTLIFGRTTYDMMKSYWPTPDAIKNDPNMARLMNTSRKIVFSKTLKSVEEGPNWKNIKLLRDIRPEEIIKLKENEEMIILGSGTIVQQLSNLGLIDQYALAIVPVILGAGKPLFKDVKMMDLELLDSKSFRNGIVFMTYRHKRKKN
jgi:dihydrofolate reductase